MAGCCRTSLPAHRPCPDLPCEPGRGDCWNGRSGIKIQNAGPLHLSQKRPGVLHHPPPPPPLPAWPAADRQSARQTDIPIIARFSKAAPDLANGRPGALFRFVSFALSSLLFLSLIRGHGRRARDEQNPTPPQRSAGTTRGSRTRRDHRQMFVPLVGRRGAAGDGPPT